MQIADVNVLIYAFRRESPRHPEYKKWVEDLVNASRPFGASTLVFAAVARIITNPKVYADPTPLDDALEYLEVIRTAPGCLLLSPGPRHWSLFRELCVASSAKGNLIPDAYFAALAVEHDCEWVTTDRDFARFPGLRWRHPLDG